MTKLMFEKEHISKNTSTCESGKGVGGNSLEIPDLETRKPFPLQVPEMEILAVTTPVS
jgi:hypothetical protein